MLDIHDQGATCSGAKVSRRAFLRVGALALGGPTIADLLRLRASGQVTPNAKAKSVIQLWMNGGPPHLDTFDPKPHAPDDYTGPLRKAIPTNVSGIQLNATLPLLAQCADKYTILRGMTHPFNGHETATYTVQTGTLPANDNLVYPSLGAVVAFKKEEAGYHGALPPYITLTTPLGRFYEAGFLGSAYQTFATGGDPHAPQFLVQGLTTVQNMSQERLEDRRSLLSAIDTLAKDMEKDKAFDNMDAFRQRAYGLILGDAKQAFDLSREPDAVRDRYGRHRFGQSCLVARRLVEHGVPFVTVNMGEWDTHHNNFPMMKRLCPWLDQGFSALLTDLSQRGLLESTIVLWGGEFGRTPKIAWEPPWNGGRHHWNTAFSCVAAGGGFKGGAVVGTTDARGETVTQRPVYPWDLSASIYTLMGIDPMGKLPHPQGCVAYVTPLAKGKIKSGGILKEIM